MSTSTPPHGPGDTRPGGSEYRSGGWSAPPVPGSSRGGVRGLLIGLAATVMVYVVGVGGLIGAGALIADRGAAEGTGQTSGAEPGAEPSAEAGTATGEEDAATGEEAPQEDGGQVGVSSGDGVHEFGETVTFDDGSTLTVTAPVRFTREDYAAGGEDFEHHVKVKATFVNKTSKAFDPTSTTSSITSGGREGDSVFQDGLGTPESTVLPGKRVTWSMGYGVDDPDDVQVTVALGFLAYEDVIFTS
jgi:hypothetical protein